MPSLDLGPVGHREINDHGATGGDVSDPRTAEDLKEVREPRIVAAK